jgi:hypothetical protein
MFCTPWGDPLDRACRRRFEPAGTATVVVRAGSAPIDWSFLLTSDI